MCDKPKTTAQKIDESAYKKVYWFARQLVNNDKYGALGTRKQAKLIESVTLVEAHLVNKNLNDEEKFRVAKRQLLNDIENMYGPKTKAANLARVFRYELEDSIKTLDDLTIFCFTVRHVVVAINQAMEQVPSDEYYADEIEKLRSMPTYISDEDDDFDYTYATFTFGVPEEWRADFEHVKEREFGELSDAYVERMQKCYPKLDIRQMLYESVK